MGENAKEALEVAADAIKTAAIFKGSDSPLWTALEAALTELEKALSNG
jgi:hypothetical protein